MKNSSSSEDEQELCKHSEVDSLLSTKPRPPSIWFSKRFRVLILLLFGQIVFTMVYHAIGNIRYEMAFGEIKRIGNQTVTIKPPKFKWASKNIPMFNLLACGSLFGIVAGHVSQKFEGPAILGVSTLLAGVFTAATSFSANWGLCPFLAWQGLLSLLECFMTVSFTMVFAHWVPTQERSLLMPAAIAGMYVGSAIAHPFCGYLTQNWGWSMPCYATGGICVAWAILWLISVPNVPSNDRGISKLELDYILEGTGNPVLKKVHHPYKEIFKSLPFWALMMSHFAHEWAYSFTSLYLNAFQSILAKHHIKVLLLYIPNASIFIVPTASVLVSYWQNHSTMTKTQTYKTVVCAGFTVSAILLAAVTVFSLDYHYSIVISILHYVKLSMLCGKLFLCVIAVDMAPNHSGLISGLTLFFRCIGFIVFHIFGYFLKQIHKLGEWKMCLLLAAGVLFLSVIIFWMFGSSDPQPWSVSQSLNSENETKNEDVARRRIRYRLLEDTV